MWNLISHISARTQTKGVCEKGAGKTSGPTITNIKSRRMRWAGHVEHIGKIRDAYKILAGKTAGKRARCGWKENIKMEL
jgi:hypothetical protein